MRVKSARQVPPPPLPTATRRQTGVRPRTQVAANDTDHIPVFDDNSVEVLAEDLFSPPVLTTAELEERLRGMACQTPRAILGVSKNAPEDEINVALAKQLFRYHPDRLSSEHKRLGQLLCARLNGAARKLRARRGA